MTAYLAKPATHAPTQESAILEATTTSTSAHSAITAKEASTSSLRSASRVHSSMTSSKSRPLHRLVSLEHIQVVEQARPPRSRTATYALKDTTAPATAPKRQTTGTSTDALRASYAHQVLVNLNSALQASTVRSTKRQESP